MVEQEVAKAVHNFSEWRFGLILITFSSILLILYSEFTKYHILLNNPIYIILQDYKGVYFIVIAISLVLITYKYIKSYKVLIISFLIYLVISYIAMISILAGVE